MKDSINKYKYSLIFIMITILVMFFPITGKSLYFKLYEITNIKDFLTMSESGILSNSFMLVLSKFWVIRALIYGIFSTFMFIFMKNTVNKKNSSLMFISGFSFLLLDKSLFSSSFVDLYGFTKYFIGSLFLIVIMNILSKNTIQIIKKGILFTLGLICTSLVPTYAFVVLTATFIYMFARIREPLEKKNSTFLLVGELLGILPSILNYKFTYTGFSHNLIHGFIPLISESNFIIILVMSTLLLLSSIKIFLKGKRTKIVFSMIGIVSYLFSSLLSSSAILQYITFVFYTLGSIYLILELKNSIVFRRKVSYYYLFKILTIVFMCIFGNIGEGSLLFLSLIDILIILEIYDMTLPLNFLNYTWTLIFVVLASVNIYLYANTLDKFKEMNFYIKNKLECIRDEYSIPNKYYTDYLYDYIPNTKENLENYIKYYDIDVFGEIDEVNLHFKQEEK